MKKIIILLLLIAVVVFASTTTITAFIITSPPSAIAVLRQRHKKYHIQKRNGNISNRSTNKDYRFISLLYATWSSQEQQQKKQNNKSSASSSTGKEFLDKKIRQLLGVRNAATNNEQTEKWKIQLQLMKPITWVPLTIIIMLGALSSGEYDWNNPLHIIRAIFVILLIGPFSEGFAQVINDWYDRDIDAINEPYRPIPAGLIQPYEVFQQLALLFIGGVLTAIGLDYFSDNNDLPVFTAIALLGYVVSYMYSAPPIKLKQNGWLGALSIGLCYITVPWWCGHIAYTNNIEHWIIPIIFSFSGIGVAIVNDFKSITGDKQFNIQSIPILVGIDNAKYLAGIIPDIIQLIIALYIIYIMKEPFVATMIAINILPQLYLQKTLLWENPFQNDVKYMAYSQPFLLLSILITASCIGSS